jgi:hypothetical protein
MAQNNPENTERICEGWHVRRFSDRASCRAQPYTILSVQFRHLQREVPRQYARPGTKEEGVQSARSKRQEEKEIDELHRLATNYKQPRFFLFKR